MTKLGRPASLVRPSVVLGLGMALMACADGADAGPYPLYPDWCAALPAQAPCTPETCITYWCESPGTGCMRAYHSNQASLQAAREACEGIEPGPPPADGCYLWHMMLIHGGVVPDRRWGAPVCRGGAVDDGPSGAHSGALKNELRCYERWACGWTNVDVVVR